MRRARRTHESSKGFEFGQVGFPLAFSLAADAPAAAVGEALDDLLHEVLAPSSLECAGGFDERRFQGFVLRWKGSATEADRRAIADWLRARPEVGEYAVGELGRAWYGSDERG